MQPNRMTHMASPSIEALKSNWLNDPCWDIETTEGYEEYRQELYVFRLETELRFAMKSRDEYRARLEAIGKALSPYIAKATGGAE